MNTSIKNLTASAFVVVAMLTGCNSSPEQKVENAEQAVVDANANLDKANDEYLADIEKYRLETAEKIAANEKSIAEFNARVESDKKLAKADYKKKIADLEQKNTDMKKRMNDYKAEGKENWETFKTQFGKDMDELGQSIADFFK